MGYNTSPCPTPLRYLVFHREKVRRYHITLGKGKVAASVDTLSHKGVPWFKRLDRRLKRWWNGVQKEDHNTQMAQRQEKIVATRKELEATKAVMADAQRTIRENHRRDFGILELGVENPQLAESIRATEAATAEAAAARKEAKRLEKRLERLLGYGKISPSIMGLSFFFAPCVPNALLGFTPPAWRHPVAPSRCVAYAALCTHADHRKRCQPLAALCAEAFRQNVVTGRRSISCRSYSAHRSLCSLSPAPSSWWWDQCLPLSSPCSRCTSSRSGTRLVFLLTRALLRTT